LRAYLWGIETWFEFWINYLCNWCCEPTYEELKLGSFIFFMCSILSLRAYLWGIETLKNLNRDRNFYPWLRAYLWGIETSSVGFPRLSRVFVASLPMRNWNKIEKEKSSYVGVVASLPMRNWNPVVCIAACFCSRVASLPMRNWNSI